MAYIGDDSYLQLHMNLLREESKTIQVEVGTCNRLLRASNRL